MTATSTMQQQLQQPTKYIEDKEEAEEEKKEGESSTATTMELTEVFYVENRRKQHIEFQVKLNANGIEIKGKTDDNNQITEQLIRIEDIIGSRYGQQLKKRNRGGLTSCKTTTGEAPDEATPAAPTDSDGGGGGGDASAYLYIYAYRKKEKPLRRERMLRILRFRSHTEYEMNLHTAQLWHDTVLRHKYKSRGGSARGAAATAGKQLLILLNPKSGSGRGRELFQKHVAPLLREAEMKYDLQITTHPNYALEFVRTRRDLLESYSGIIVASGDGLFYEVLNGLMGRMDWRRACAEIPLGIIPCGSGNGLAKSVAHHCNEPYEPKPILNAAITCLSGRDTPMDVVRVELSAPQSSSSSSSAAAATASPSPPTTNVLYSFLSVGWGLIADIDIESERLRSIGAQRFTLWAIKRVITLRSYKGKLFYLPSSGSGNTNTTNTTTSKSKQMPSGERRSLPNNVMTSMTSTEFHDLSDEEDVVNGEFADAISMDRSISVYREPHDSWRSAISKRTAYYSIDGGQSIRSNRSSSRNSRMMQRISEANAQYANVIPTGTMPGLHLPLQAADGWISEDGDFVMVHAAYTTHLSSDVFFAPASRLNDGLIYLVIIRAGVSRTQLVNFMMSLSDGSHLPSPDDPHIQVIAVRAFRIEPSGNDGILTVDGERVDYGHIQAEIIPGLVNVMTTNG